MQIVIDIPEEDYILARKNDYSAVYKGAHIAEAIKNGTPLPKGHGRLIDVSEYFKKEFGDAREFLDKATTIIEADKESEGEE
jgi:hypothetical protein